MKELKYLLCVRQSVSKVLYMFCLTQSWKQLYDLGSIVPILQIEELVLTEVN